MYSLLVILVPLSTCSLLLQAQLSSLHVQFALRDWTKIPVEFSQLFAIILSIALVSQNGQIRLVQCADTASNSQKNQYVLYAKLLRTSGCVLYVVLWAVGGIKADML